MAQAGKRRATRRSLTLLEVLVVMLLIGILAAGGLQLGKQATERVSAQVDARKLLRKLRLLSATALAHESPIALHLSKDGVRWRGSFVGRGVSLRPFSLTCDTLLLEGKPQISLLIQADEHGEIAMPSLQWIHGRIKTDVVLHESY
jgi:prepilin-type N-terminal cleavage/methylation domain-containing protein